MGSPRVRLCELVGAPKTQTLSANGLWPNSPLLYSGNPRRRKAVESLPEELHLWWASVERVATKKARSTFSFCNQNHVIRMGILRDKKAVSSLATAPCAHLRTAYHNCFNIWYSEKFLKSDWNKQDCVLEWEKYRECLSRHLDDKHLRRLLETDAGGAVFESSTGGS